MCTREKKRKRSILSRICCPWGSSKQQTRVQTQASNTNEPSEYVLEKLAIKALPLGSFGTSEELLRLNRLANGPYITQSPMMSPTASSSSPPREPSTTLTPLPPHVACISSHNAVIKHDETINPFHMQYTPKTIMVQDKEAQMVSNILNKHASLYTLDEKNPIPKDPMHPPRNTVVIPSSVQEAYAKDNKINLMQGKTHSQSGSSKFPIRPPTCKKDMTPEIKETINALRLAQKPHFPGVQPKNQKSITPSITPRLTETEISSRLLVDTVSENDSSFKIATEKFPTVMPLNSKFTYDQKVPKIVEHSEEEELLANIYLQRKSGPPSEVDTKKLSQSEEKNVLSNEVEKTEVIKSTSMESMEEYPQKTESTALNQLKCQNLKWKIIIKHHAEKSKRNSDISKSCDNKDLQYNTRQCLLDSNLNFPG